MINLFYKFNCLKWYWKLPLFLLLLLIMSSNYSKKAVRYKYQIATLTRELNNISYKKIIKEGVSFKASDLIGKDDYYYFINFINQTLADFTNSSSDLVENIGLNKQKFHYFYFNAKLTFKRFQSLLEVIKNSKYNIYYTSLSLIEDNYPILNIRVRFYTIFR